MRGGHATRWAQGVAHPGDVWCSACCWPSGSGAPRLRHGRFVGRAQAPGPDFLIIGHRGAPNQACENTLESFAQALHLGANALEFEVSITRDGHPVCGMTRTIASSVV